MEAFITSSTPIKPISVRPIAVKRVRAEKGVIMAQPGIKSFALRSIDQTRPSSPVNLLYRLFWFLADRSLQRQASLVNLRLRQLPNIRC
jgi:hypothetical protein